MDFNAMLALTKDLKTKNLIITVVVLGIMYFYFLKKRNDKLPRLMLIYAVFDFVGLLVILFFAWVGISTVIVIIKTKEYESLILPLAVFLICYKPLKNIIYRNFHIGSQGRRTIFKRSELKIIRKETNRYIICSLFALFIVVGLLMLNVWMREVIIHHQTSRNYAEVTGSVINVETYLSEDRKLYLPIYMYTVDDVNYTVKPKYKTETPFLRGETRIIKYHPNNPKKAIVLGSKPQTAILIPAIIFLFTPWFFVLLIALEDKDKYKHKIDIIIGVWLGILIICCFMAYDIIAYVLDTYNPLTLIAREPLILIPIILGLASFVILIYVTISRYKKSKHDKE